MKRVDVGQHHPEIRRRVEVTLNPAVIGAVTACSDFITRVSESRLLTILLQQLCNEHQQIALQKQHHDALISMMFNRFSQARSAIPWVAEVIVCDPENKKRRGNAGETPGKILP